MKLLEVRVSAVRYALREPLATAHGSLALREGVRVELIAQGPGGSLRGSGEALPLPALGTESAQQCWAAAQEQAAALQGEPFELEALLAQLAERLASTPAARAAFDLAAHDLASRARGVAVAALCLPACAPAAQELVRVNAVCGPGAAPRLLAAAQRARAAGYCTLKLKVGSPEPEDDLARVAALRAALGPGPRLRLDANGAWSVARAQALLERLAAHDIELCEQPVPAHDLEGLARLHRESPIPVAADEALALAEGRAACAEGGLAAFAVLKPTLLGGLAPAVALALRAARHGVRAIVTTSLDAPLGTAAALALAAAVGAPQHAHGLDAAAWVDCPFPPALVPQRGLLHTRSEAGLLGDG